MTHPHPVLSWSRTRADIKEKLNSLPLDESGATAPASNLISPDNLTSEGFAYHASDLPDRLISVFGMTEAMVEQPLTALARGDALAVVKAMLTDIKISMIRADMMSALMMANAEIASMQIDSLVTRENPPIRLDDDDTPIVQEVIDTYIKISSWLEDQFD